MESFKEVFSLVSDYCKGPDGVTEVAHSLWIKDIEPVKFENSTAYLRVSSQFKKEIIEEKYLPLLSRAFEHILGFSVNIKILCDSAPKQEPPESGMLSGYSQEELEKSSQGGEL